MWLILFTLSMAAAAAFSLIAIMVQQRTGFLRIADPPPGSDLMLFRRMRLLDLDAAEVAQAEPLSFWELEARCRTCNSKERCAYDLAGNSPDWRAYCPNTPMLGLLSTVRPYPSAPP
jgi:hypothetical protein